MGSVDRAREELDRLEASSERVEVTLGGSGADVVASGNVPARDVIAGDVPAGDVPAGDVPAGDVPAGDVIVARCFGHGPPVVLLHGGSGSWNHWVRTIPTLASRFRVVALDLPGFGDSSLPGTVRSAHDLAQCTTRALRRLVPRGRYGLVGFSFGGIIAGLVAGQRRSRVERLLLIAAGGLGLAGNVDRPLLPIPPGATEEERFAAHRHNLSVLMIADPAKVDDLAVLIHDENVAKARFRTGSIPASTTLADALPAVRAPMSYLAGDRDAFGADGGSRRDRLLRALRPDCELLTVPGAGHWAMYEEPEIVNRLLQERLATVA